LQFLLDGFIEAWRLVIQGDPRVFHAIVVTALCTTIAVTLAAFVALPYGTWLGMARRDGSGIQVFLIRIGMFAPTIVVGLIVYALLSRAGLFGGLDLLFTKSAIIIGEFLLAFPLIAALAHGTVAGIDRRVPETARTLGAGRLRTILAVMSEARVALVAAYLAAYARCFSELGVAITAGGGIEMRTRTLSATISYELSKGSFGRGLACGIILMVLAVGVAILAHRLSRETKT
jgi:tungstate transport system permease protein